MLGRDGSPLKVQCKNTKELMHCHCGTNNRAPRWTFTDPCKPKSNAEGFKELKLEGEDTRGKREDYLVYPILCDLHSRDAPPPPTTKGTTSDDKRRDVSKTDDRKREVVKPDDERDVPKAENSKREVTKRDDRAVVPRSDDRQEAATEESATLALDAAPGGLHIRSISMLLF